MSDRIALSGPAAARWAADLEAWAIPEPILSAAVESPWELPAEVFERRAERTIGQLVTPSARSAAAALDPPGSVLDVGAGGGAAGLALISHLSQLTAVDTHEAMLAGLARRAMAAGVAVTVVRGRWPDVAGEVAAHDVVVCHHVLYNAPDIAAFLRALTDHARRRVVLEITARHPLAPLNPLWRRFHRIERPERPTATDVVSVLRELGVEPQVEAWAREPSDELPFSAQVALARRRLCLAPDREEEVAAALRTLPDGPTLLVTLSWAGGAQEIAR